MEHDVFKSPPQFEHEAQSPTGVRVRESSRHERERAVRWFTVCMHSHMGRGKQSAVCAVSKRCTQGTVEHGCSRRVGSWGLVLYMGSRLDESASLCRGTAPAAGSQGAPGVDTAR